jgi:DNA recombination protein RmuC
MGVMPQAVYSLLWFLLGALAGWLIAAARRKTASGDDALARELRQQLQQRETEVVRLQEQVTARTAEVGVAQANVAAAERMFAEQRHRLSENLSQSLEAESAARERLGTVEAQLNETRSSLASLRAQMEVHERSAEELRQTRIEQENCLAALRQQLQNSEKARSASEEKARYLDHRLAEERKNIEQLQAKFIEEFTSVSNKLLVDNASRFSRESGENLEKILAPFKENLTDFKTRLEAAQKESSTYSALLKDQIGRIGNEAATLSRALKGDIKVLGNWGENRLDQILEKSGLQQEIHYQRQVALKSDEGGQRFLDVVVRLPDAKTLVIDCKVPLKNFEAHINAPEEELRAAFIAKLADDFRKHFKELGAKRYHDLYGIHSPDFVLMYVPLEPAYFAALSHEPELFSEALDRNVVLITNSTLLATLRTVASVWKLADQQRNALEIAERGGRLYDKFVNFIQDLERIGSSLDAGQRAWDEAVKKLHQGPGNLVKQTEELKRLGVKAAKSLPQHLLDAAGPAELPPPPKE